MDSDSSTHSNSAPPKLDSNKKLDCRMYVNEYPSVDDLVVVKVTSIVDMGAYCSLLEYNDIEGMILMSELSRRRIRSVNRLIRVGRQEIVAVLRVNKEKGYIDLSKKRVNAEEVLLVEEKWNKSKAVHSILRHVARNTNFGVLELYQRFGWPMAEKFGHAYNGLKYAMENREQFLKLFDVPKEIYGILFKNIEKRLKQQVVTIRCPIECTCFTIDGILAIKKALKKGLELSSDDFVVKIKLEAAPRYMLTLSTLQPQEGHKKINEVIEIITKDLVGAGGHISVKAPPKAAVSSDPRFSSISSIKDPTNND